MPPLLKRPYDLMSLTWNQGHTRNDQDIYCYCGKGYNPHKSMAQCQRCEQWYHCDCMACLKKRPLMFGDVFYDFVCSICAGGDEQFQHDTLTWIEAVQLVLFHLTRLKRLSKGKQQEHFYFRYANEICELAESEWDRILAPKPQTSMWRNTIASTLSTHPKLFLSGAALSDYGKGWWALVSEEPLLRQKRKARAMPSSGSEQKITKKLKRRAIKQETDASPASDDASPKKQKIESTMDQDPRSPKKSGKQATRESSGDDDGESQDAAKDGPKLRLISQQDEWHILQELEHASGELPPEAMRLRRKLALRRLKRSLHLKLFDIDAAVRQQLRGKGPMEPMNGPAKDALLPTSATEAAGAGSRAAKAEAEARSKEQLLEKGTPYQNSFASRLYGTARRATTLTANEPWLSAWNGRKLRPFIRRDYENKTARMLLLDQITIAKGQPRVAKTLGTEYESHANDTSIDYVYFQRELLDPTNQLLRLCFWDGIDVSESLQFPEYSIVALYKRCVVGCAFMTPEAYITYFAVLPGWERAGIGQFMLYHLFQTMISKDITLHVSANNNAMILYQKFGFKPEEFIVNFYDKYLPNESIFSKNAFFLRLRR
ncbi:hypothetical protein BC940DRAFT_296166 [Gongronella butleri]|nr:hypothetical protein BC940DRAFT_296166 [Gongronella butleri]